MSVTRWDPFRDLLTIQDEMARLFDRAYTGRGGGTGEGATPRLRGWVPALDIAEEEDSYLVSAELPGVKADDLDITLEEGLLTIQGERRFEEETGGRQYHRIERHYGSFRRAITLPSQVQADRIEARFEGGVLIVRVPKADEAKPRKIQVQVGGNRPPVSGESTVA